MNHDNIKTFYLIAKINLQNTNKFLKESKKLLAELEKDKTNLNNILSKNEAKLFKLQNKVKKMHPDLVQFLKGAAISEQYLIDCMDILNANSKSAGDLYNKYTQEIRDYIANTNSEKTIDSRMLHFNHAENCLKKIKQKECAIEFLNASMKKIKKENETIDKNIKTVNQYIAQGNVRKTHTEEELIILKNQYKELRYQDIEQNDSSKHCSPVFKSLTISSLFSSSLSPRKTT